MKRDPPVNALRQQEEDDFQIIGTPYLTHLTIHIARVVDIFGQEIACLYGTKNS